MPALAVATFWLLVCLPGVALLRRWRPRSLEGGLPSAVTLGYLASFALLSLVSIAGYVLHLPLAVLSGAIVLAVAVGAAWLVRDLVRQRWRPSFSLPAIVVGALIAIDLTMSLRVGGHFGGDARYHIARVRILLDHGFNNWDPLVSGHRFDATYHTNLYHALMAAAAQLMRLSPSEVWAYSWFWAKLVAATTAFHLAWSVFRERTLAWSAAAGLTLWMAPSAVLLYPNTITKLWLVPLALAFVIDALRDEGSEPADVGLAAVAFLLPQFHGLYYIFTGLIAGPLLLLAATRAALRRAPNQRRLWAALLVLGLGAPWLGVTLWQRAHPTPDAAVPAAIAEPALVAAMAAQTTSLAPTDSAEQAARRRFRGFVRLDDGGLMLNPKSLLNPEGRQLHLWIALLLGLCTRHRRAVAVLAGATFIILAVLHIPALCTALVKVAGAPWIVRRLSAVTLGMHLAIVPGALLWFVLDRWRNRWTELLCVASAIGYGQTFGVDAEPWTREAYVEEARDPMYLPERLARHARKRALLYATLPSEAVIVAPLDTTGDLIINCDCYRLALDDSEPKRGVRDMAERRAAVTLLLGEELDLDARIALLRRYHVRHLLASGSGGRALEKIYAPITQRVARFDGMRVLTLDTEGSARAP